MSVRFPAPRVASFTDRITNYLFRFQSWISASRILPTDGVVLATC